MVVRFIGFVFVGTLSFLMTIPAAYAAERLLIPFACEARGGQVQAYPSDYQSYRIIGGRETAPFTACASDASNQCRTMMLHRFAIDCDGARVSWPDFYAAISDATTGRALRDGDRLLVRVRPERIRRGRRSRFDPLRSRRSFVIEMPDGFAPVRGTVARFEGGPVRQRSQRLKPTRDPFTAPAPAPDRIAQNPPADTAPPPRVRPAPQRATDPNPALNPKAKPKLTAKAVPAKEKKKGMVIKTVPKQPQERAKSDTPKSVSPGKPQATPPANKPTARSVAASKPAPSKPKVAQSETRRIVPTLLNGPKAAKAKLETGAKEPKAAKPAASLPKSGAELLQDRAAKVNTGVKHGSGLVADTRAAAPPTLANTLAVFAIVASLLLALSFAAYRMLTPPSARIAKRAPEPVTATATPMVSEKDPDFAALSAAKAPTAQPKLADARPVLMLPSSEPEKSAASQQGDDAPARLELEVAPERAPEIAKPKLLAQRPPVLDAQDVTLPEGSADSADTDAKPDPELPMPTLVATKLKPADFDESALLLPKTRQEALAALGIGDSASTDVIERVVAGLRQCWRPDDAGDKKDRERRQQRMEQIETAWQILSSTQRANSPANHARERPL